MHIDWTSGKLVVHIDLFIVISGEAIFRLRHQLGQPITKFINLPTRNLRELQVFLF